MHKLYKEFVKATKILRARGLVVMGPEEAGAEDHPSLLVKRDDFNIAEWFTFEIDCETGKSYANVYCPTVGGSIDNERYGLDFSTAKKIVAAYDKAVKNFVTEHNKDRDGFKKQLMGYNREEWSAEESVMRFMGLPYKIKADYEK